MHTWRYMVAAATVTLVWVVEAGVPAWRPVSGSGVLTALPPPAPPRSWLPTNSSSGELCQMTNAGDLPESFLLVSAGSWPWHLLAAAHRNGCCSPGRPPRTRCVSHPVISIESFAPPCGPLPAGKL